MAKLGLNGGKKLQAKLDAILGALNRGDAVRVGFFEHDTYPDGTPVAMVAVVQEFGGTIKVPEREATLNFKMNERTGEVGNRFVKTGQANFTQQAVIPAHEVTIPPRPFFRTAIEQHGKAWGAQAGKFLKATDFNADRALGLLGQLIERQVQASIRGFSDPPNAPSTIAAKGFNQPLIDTGRMLQSVSYEVVKGANA